MESLNRLVAESLARHGFDRPVDYRRLHWSSWFRCESHHSLLSVPSKPGIFAIAEEIMDFGPAPVHVETDAFVCPPLGTVPETSGFVSGHRFSGAANDANSTAALAAAGAKRMLAVLQFTEDDDMAFVLDRMMSRLNPMRSRLASGRCFIRYVVIEDQAQRRSLCNSLNQWLTSSTEKATGIGAHFATSLDLSTLEANVSTDRVSTGDPTAQADTAQPYLRSGAANIHCPHPLPSGF